MWWATQTKQSPKSVPPALMLVLNTITSHCYLEVQDKWLVLCHEGSLRSQWFGANCENGMNVFAKTSEHLVAFKAKLTEFLMKLSISVWKIDLLGNLPSQNVLNRLPCSPPPFHEDVGFLQVGLSGLWENQVPDTPVRPVMNFLWQKPRGKLPGTGKENGKLGGIFFLLFFLWQDMDWR